MVSNLTQIFVQNSILFHPIDGLFLISSATLRQDPNAMQISFLLRCDVFLKIFIVKNLGLFYTI